LNNQAIVPAGDPQTPANNTNLGVYPGFVKFVNATTGPAIEAESAIPRPLAEDGQLMFSASQFHRQFG
jgi:hypothetical protein